VGEPVRFLKIPLDASWCSTTSSTSHPGRIRIKKAARGGPQRPRDIDPCRPTAIAGCASASAHPGPKGLYALGCMRESEPVSATPGRMAAQRPGRPG